MTASVAFRAAKLLREARDLISSPDKWVKGWFGTHNGRAADDDLLHADRVCSLGALGKAAGMSEWRPWDLEEALVAQDYLERSMGMGSVPAFNDASYTRHEDVLAAFDLAIEEACKVVRQEVEDKNQMSKRLAKAMAAARLLTEARDFIKGPDHWIRGSLYNGISAFDANGSLAAAPRVCAIGGVMRAANLGLGAYNDISAKTHSEAFEALRVLAGAIQGDMNNEDRRRKAFHWWGPDIHVFNDDLAGHQDVIAAFDKAIEHQCAVVRELAAQTELSLDGKKDNAS